MDNQYMLITVCDREILTERFSTKKEAQKIMHREMVKWGNVPRDIFENEEYEDQSCGFGEYSAWANDGIDHANLDWLIVRIW